LIFVDRCHCEAEGRGNLVVNLLQQDSHALLRRTRNDRKFKMIPFGDLKRQYVSIKGEVDAAVAKVFDDGWFILGKQGEEFEKEFAKYNGCKYAVGVGSGTEALHLSLIASGIGAGDEVLTVSNTAAFTVSAISFANAKPVFVDVDKDFYTIATDDIERHITKKTKAIIPVHLYGQSADMGPIIEIAKKHGLKVIEDACQAHGTEYKGQQVGSVGDTGCFSFYPSKNLGGYGDGGMITTNNPEIYEKLKMLRNGGQEKRYYHKIIGFNSRLDEIQAAILRVKLKYLDSWNAARQKNAALYDTLINNSKIIKPRKADYSSHNYHLYVIRTKERDRLQKHLERHGVQTLIHYPVPIHLQEAYRELNLGKGTCPVAETYADEILSLPMFPELTENEIGQVCEIINGF